MNKNSKNEEADQTKTVYEGHAAVRVSSCCTRVVSVAPYDCSSDVRTRPLLQPQQLQQPGLLPV